MEIGEFVRTKDGRIGKILEPKPEYFDKTLVNKTKGISVYVFIDYGGIIEYCKITEIKKNSKIISEVVNVGDYVNGKLIHKIDKGSNYCYLHYGNCKTFVDYQIKSILTHEQYEKNCYKMEE